MSQPVISVLEARGIHVALDLELGQIAALRVSRDGRDASPFHRVPWAEEDLSHVDVPPHLRRMSIDFFCAPFAEADVEPAPFHGWPANSAWHPVEEQHFPGGMSRSYRLERTVMGATLLKTLTVRDDHPFLYQTHRFEGGTGRIPVAHHTMVHFPQTGLLSFSNKLRAESPLTPLEPDAQRGVSVFRYPASGSVEAFPLSNGESADLRTYPVADQHDDLVLLVEDPSNPVGWAAAVRPEQQDMALLLKSPAHLPVTVLWYSNGGRSYAPWNGIHRGVLGIEEACSNFGLGHRASIEANRLADSGVATAASLDGGIEIRTILGCVPVEGTPARVRSLEMRGQELVVVTDSATSTLPCDCAFLQG